VVPVAELNKSFGLDTWVYRGADWYVPDPQGAHVARESWTVRFEPKVMTSLDGLTTDVAKLVGVSDDVDAVARAASAAHDRFGDHVTAARSSRTTWMSPTRTPTRAPSPGTWPRSTRSPAGHRHDRRHAERRLDVRPLRSEHRDGNASPEVQRAARRITTSNAEEASPTLSKGSFSAKLNPSRRGVA